MFNLELNKVIDRIKKKKSKNLTVLVQLPDGLKPKAKEIVDSIRDKTSAEVIIWFGSCYGACDLPLGVGYLGVDLVVQWGHNKFNKVDGW